MNKVRLAIVACSGAMMIACGGPGGSNEPAPAAAGQAASEAQATAGIEMRPRPTDPADFPEYIDYLVEVSYPRTAEERAQDEPIQEKFRGRHNIDSIVIAAPGFPADITLEQYEEYMEHFIENGFTSMSVTVSNGSDDSVEQVFERIENFNQYLAERPDRYMQIRSLGDFETALNEGKLGAFYNFQSMNAFGEDLANIAKYYELGLRTTNFTYNQDNAYAGGTVSNEDGSNDGVTELGRQAVAEMNRVGMVIDCSHSSDQTCIDAAALTTKPMIMSHSNASALHPIGRNNSDEAMKAVAATGGAICINFIGGFLNAEGDARPESIAEHIQHVRELAGPGAVCAGSDYVYNYAGTLDWILRNPDQFPPSMGYATPSHMGMPGEIWGAVRYLQEHHGWTDDEIAALLGGNLLRVYKANWK